MFNNAGEWIRLETYDDFDNGLSDLIDLWASHGTTITESMKNSALTHFKKDLEEASLMWETNRAKSKKYAAILAELAEFESVLNGVAGQTPGASDI